MKLLKSNYPRGFIILEAQNDKELKYLNTLIKMGKGFALGESYQIGVTLKNHSLEEFKTFLRDKRGFKLEGE